MHYKQIRTTKRNQKTYVSFCWSYIHIRSIIFVSILVNIWTNYVWAVRRGGGGGGAGDLVDVGRWVGEGAIGTKLYGGGILVSRNCFSSTGAEAVGFWLLSFSWISKPGLRSSQILFIQLVDSNLINVIQQPPRWYYF